VPVGVAISGSGSNLQALLDAFAADDAPAQICVVVSNRADAFGLERARRAGVPAVVLPHKGRERAAFDADLAQIFVDHGAQWVCLAGFLRVVGPGLLDRFPGRVLNIHPALLPAFPGLHAQAQALEAGARVAGATVHFVDGGVDTGPIVAQGAVPVLPDDDLAALQGRVLAMEHRLYPLVVRLAAEGRLALDGRRVRVALRPGESLTLFG
jgi:phosphoribosylglycinamide formyltransferase-1